MKSQKKQFHNKNSSNDWGENPDHIDLDFLEKVISKIIPLYSENGLLPVSVKGWENVPQENVLYISNHSGGTSTPDVWGMMVAWFMEFGKGRIVHPMGHDMLFTLPFVAKAVSKMGILRALPDMGRVVLQDYKRDAFVCPGGDLDVWRPWHKRYQVTFSGRNGYAKLALKTGTPIVPIVHGGPHETLIVLTDGRRIASMLNFPKHFRAKIFPIHISLPWGLGVGPLPHIPIPTMLKYRVGKPIYPPCILKENEEPSVELIDHLDKTVQNSMQELLNELKEERDPLGTKLKIAGRQTKAFLQNVVLEKLRQ